MKKYLFNFMNIAKFLNSILQIIFECHQKENQNIVKIIGFQNDMKIYVY